MFLHLCIVSSQFLDRECDKTVFFNPFFTKLAGQELLKEKIENGWNTQEIMASWKEDIEKYKRLRTPYLLYPL